MFLLNIFKYIIFIRGGALVLSTAQLPVVHSGLIAHEPLQLPCTLRMKTSCD